MTQKFPVVFMLSLHQLHTFKLITATLFPGTEFLFSITQVIDFRQGRTTYAIGPNKGQISLMLELTSEKEGGNKNNEYMKLQINK